MSIEIDCPSGMRLRIRGLRGKEGKLLTDRVALRQGSTFDNILRACTEDVVDPGPYTMTKEGTVDWNEVLVGDRFYTLLQIRVASFGSDYSFRVQCSDQACRERFEYSINLDTDLEVTRLTDEDRKTLAAGGMFTTEMGTGQKVKYRLATGADEKKVIRNNSADRALVDMLAQRIVSIEGVGEATESDIINQRTVRSTRAFLEDQEWSELVALLNALDSHDCGVKTEILVECPSCGGIQELNLPFDRNFLLPKEMGAKQKSMH